MPPHPVLLAFAGVVGLCVGSFLNVAAYRLPRRQSLVAPPSHCPPCGRRVPWWGLLPLAGYAMARGRCGGCGVRISPRYPLVEAATAVLAVGALWGLGATEAALKVVVGGGFLLTAAEADRQTGLIPDALVAWATGAGLLFALAAGTAAFGGAVLAAATCGLLLYAARVLGSILFGRPGVGLGDVKLAVPLGLFLGWEALWALYLAIAIGGAYGLAGIAAGRLRRDTRIPFAPFIAAGVLCALTVLPASALLSLAQP